MKLSKLKIKFSPKIILLVFIILLAFFLRIHKIQDNFHFSGDEGRDAIIARDIILGNNFPLLGPPSSVGDVNLGPFYYYAVAPFLFVSRFHPIGPVFIIIITSSLTTALIYLLGQSIFKDKRISLLSSLFFAISPAAVTAGRWSWNPNIMPFFAALFFLSLWKGIYEKRAPWLILTGISLALILQSHYIGVVSILILLVVLISQRKILSKKTFLYLIIFFGILAISFFPIIYYDLSRNFRNIRGILSLLSGGQGEKTNIIIDILTSGFALITQFIGNNILAIITFFVTSWIIFLEKSYKSKRVLLLVGGVAFTVFAIAYLSVKPQLHYFEYAWPSLTLLLGYTVTKLIKKYQFAGLLLLAFLLVTMFTSSVKQINSIPKLTYKIISQITDRIDIESQGKEFNIAVLSETNRETSYIYFFKLKNSPVKTDVATDQLFVICEDVNNCKYRGHPKFEVAIFEVKYNGQVETEHTWDWGEIKVMKVVPKDNL